MVAGGHAWLWGGVWLPGGVHSCGGHAWLRGDMHGCQGVVCGCRVGARRIRQYTVNEGAVRILLECILVLRLISIERRPTPKPSGLVELP